MNLLVVTNLYPPQELGGYGRSIADFVWGLRERRHHIQVLSSNAPHLGANSDLGPSGKRWTGDSNLKEVMKVVFGRCKTDNAKPLIDPMCAH